MCIALVNLLIVRNARLPVHYAFHCLHKSFLMLVYLQLLKHGICVWKVCELVCLVYGWLLSWYFAFIELICLNNLIGFLYTAFLTVVHLRSFPSSIAGENCWIDIFGAVIYMSDCLVHEMFLTLIINTAKNDQSLDQLWADVV